MSGGGGGDKTEKPTPKRIADARKEGQVARSPDVGAWASILVAAWVLPLLVSTGTERLRAMLVEVGALIRVPEEAVALGLVADAAGTLALLTVPFGAVLLLVAVAGSAVQGGVHLATKNFKPKAKRLDPLQGFKRIAGPNALWEAVKALVKTTVVAVLVWRVVDGLVPVLTASGALPLSTVLAEVAGTALALVRDVAVAAFVMGIADWAYQRRRLEKQLKMTRKEVQDEHKQAEGDPHLKGAIRSKQMAMSRNRMMADVATADVVVVNPTHVAVALRYQPDRGAPRVVAKGSGAVAARIRARAEENRVPLVQDVPLARALHKACEVGQEIPAELFTAVARVLAFVLSLKARGAVAGTHRVPIGAGPRRR